jgi:alpha-ketoglutarate-dependent taurine dioxygenase
MLPLERAPLATPFDTPAAWEASALRTDGSWLVRLADPHRAELLRALDHYKEAMRARGMTAQWLHGHAVPPPEDFPLPTLGPVLRKAQRDLEERYGLVVLRGAPVAGLGTKDLHLLHAGLAGHVGTPRPQTVFAEMVQDLRDAGQASLIERRGSKHNRALPLHSDPCDAVSFLCIRGPESGGTSIFASSVAIHNALLRSAPEHAETLYGDLVHTYQDYLFVRTGWNQGFVPRERTYRMPAFTAEQGYFACKYSRFYIDQAQELPEVPRLSAAQRDALDALEEEMRAERWQLRLQYEPGDVTFINNFVCLHARTAFTDDPRDETRRRHLLRIWLSMPNSRPLSAHWKRQVFFRRIEAGALRGGVPVPEISDS